MKAIIEYEQPIEEVPFLEKCNANCTLTCWSNDRRRTANPVQVQVLVWSHYNLQSSLNANRAPWNISLPKFCCYLTFYFMDFSFFFTVYANFTIWVCAVQYFFLFVTWARTYSWSLYISKGFQSTSCCQILQYTPLPDPQKSFGICLALYFGISSKFCRFFVVCLVF